MAASHTYDPGKFKPAEYKLIDDKIVKISDVVVYEFQVGDVEDPAIYAAGPIIEWQESEAGKFVMANAVETPWYTSRTDYTSYGLRYSIIARMMEQDQTFWRLKFK